MKKLLNYILETITGKTNFEIEEKLSEEDNQITYDVKADDDVLGLIIGRNGRTIKAIQDILRVKARLENKSVWINVSGKNETEEEEGEKRTEKVKEEEQTPETTQENDKEKPSKKDTSDKEEDVKS